MNGYTFGPANRLRKGYGGPPKLYAKAEAERYEDYEDAQRRDAEVAEFFL